ncbi:MAG: PIN domain-containing protein [Ignavibacteriae bacterium]|nr:PIN domain-containing protein [Ignavibacteriota bacterium]
MSVLVDTCIWSLVLRRENPREDLSAELQVLAEAGSIAIIGPIRQELLSGVKDRKVFNRLAERLHAFQDIPLSESDFVRAAAFYNAARGRGVQGSNTDFLICAVASARGIPVFTVDADFHRFATFLPFRLYEWQSPPRPWRVNEPPAAGVVKRKTSATAKKAR